MTIVLNSLKSCLDIAYYLSILYYPQKNIPGVTTESAAMAAKRVGSPSPAAVVPPPSGKLDTNGTSSSGKHTSSSAPTEKTPEEKSTGAATNGGNTSVTNKNDAAKKNTSEEGSFGPLNGLLRDGRGQTDPMRVALMIGVVSMGLMVGMKKLVGK